MIDLYNEAISTVIQKQKVSTSILGSLLHISYGRAVDLIAQMERGGVVSAPNYLGVRKVLIKDTQIVGGIQ